MEGRTSSLGSAQQFYVAVSSSEVKVVRKKYSLLVFFVSLTRTGLVAGFYGQ